MPSSVLGERKWCRAHRSSPGNRDLSQSGGCSSQRGELKGGPESRMAGRGQARERLPRRGWGIQECRRREEKKRTTLDPGWPGGFDEVVDDGGRLNSVSLSPVYLQSHQRPAHEARWDYRHSNLSEASPFPPPSPSPPGGIISAAGRISPSRSRSPASLPLTAGGVRRAPAGCLANQDVWCIRTPFSRR